MQGLLLVPLDGSLFAEQALPIALALARRMQARLHLVCVRASLPVAADDMDAAAYLARSAAQHEPELPHRISYEVLTDEYGPLEYPPPARSTVAEVVARFSESHDVAMIVMTTHGRGGIRRAWIGSVADSLLRTARVPLLLLRPSEGTHGSAPDNDPAFRHILIPLDGSVAAERVMASAQRIGSAFAARYTLVRVLSPLTWGDGVPAAAAGLRAAPLSRRLAGDYLEACATQLRARGVSVATQLLDGWSPAPVIIDYANAHDVDLIAVATTGASTVRRLLLGNVADSLIRGTVVPVLACHPEQPAATASGSAAAAQRGI